MEINIRQMKTRNRPDYLLNDSMIVNINPIQDGLFRGCSRMRGAGGGGRTKSPHLSKICHTYPTLMKLGTVIPHLKKLQKIQKSRDTPFEFC